MFLDLGAAGVDGALDGLALDVRHVVVESQAQVAVVVALVDQELAWTRGGQQRARVRLTQAKRLKETPDRPRKPFRL